MSRTAIKRLYEMDRQLVPVIWAVIDLLTENPDEVSYQPDEDEPSEYWLAVDGDVVVSFEILDEVHAIKILNIE